MHGSADRVVPQRFGREIFEAAREPKRAFFPESGNHVNLLDLPQVRAALGQFLAEFAPRPDLPSP